MYQELIVGCGIPLEETTVIPRLGAKAIHGSKGASILPENKARRATKESKLRSVHETNFRSSLSFSMTAARSYAEGIKISQPGVARNELPQVRTKPVQLHSSRRSRIIPDSSFQNQWRCMASRNSWVIGNPDADPITESIPHSGQSAVVPTSAISSTHSVIVEGEYVRRQ